MEGLNADLRKARAEISLLQQQLQEKDVAMSALSAALADKSDESRPSTENGFIQNDELSHDYDDCTDADTLRAALKEMKQQQAANNENHQQHMQHLKDGLSSVIESLRDELTEAHDQRRQTEQQVEEERNSRLEIEHQQQEMEEMIESLQAQCSKELTSLQELGEENLTLKTDIENLTKAVEKAEAEKDLVIKSNENIEYLSNKLKDATEERDELRNTLSKFEDDLDQINVFYEDALKELEVKRASNSQLEAKRSELVADIMMLKSSREQERKSLLNENESLKTDKIKLSSRLMELEEGTLIPNLQCSLDKLEKSALSKEQEIERINAEKAELKDDLGRREEEIKTCKEQSASKLDAVMTDLNLQKEKISILEDESREATMKLESQAENEESLRKQLEEAESIKSELQTQRDDLKNTNEHLCKNLAECMVKLEASNAEKSEALAKCIELEQSLEEQNAQLERRKACTENTCSFASKYNVLETTLSNKLAEAAAHDAKLLSSKQQEVIRLKEELENMNTLHTQMEEEIAGMRNDFQSRIQKETEASTNRFNELQAEHSRATNELKEEHCRQTDAKRETQLQIENERWETEKRRIMDQCHSELALRLSRLLDADNQSDDENLSLPTVEEKLHNYISQLSQTQSRLKTHIQQQSTSPKWFVTLVKRLIAPATAVVLLAYCYSRFTP